MRKLIVIAAVILAGCAPMTPEQAARADAAFQNSLYQYHQGGQQKLDYLRQQQLIRDQQPWPSQMNRPMSTTCRPNYLNPSQLDCVSR